MTSVIAAMLASYPETPIDVQQEILTRCIVDCRTCALACTACSDACMAEPDVATLVTCMRTDLDCADVCDATAKMLTRQTGYDLPVIRSVVRACLDTIVVCAEECERHAAHHKHCEISAKACREAEGSCRNLLTALGSPETDRRR